MSERDDAPDPVAATAPEAPPAPDDAPDDESAPQPGAVFPVGGMGTGTAPPPVIPGRSI